MPAKKTTAPQPLRLAPCILATACIPWTRNGGLAEDIFLQYVRKLRRTGFENLYIFGTAGEGYAVTTGQFREIATLFHAAASGGRGLCQLGVIGMSTAQVRERIDIGMEIGFRDFQISLPSWGALNDAELARFFRDVLDAYPAARFLHYNNNRTGRRLTGMDYARIVDRHPNLVATKSGGHTVPSLLALLMHAPRLCHFFTELDYATAAMLGGRCGLLAALSAGDGPRAKRLFDAGRRHRHGTLLKLTYDYAVLREKLLQIVNGEGGHMDGAYDKLFAQTSIPGFPLELLSPYQGASPAAARKFQAARA